MSLFGKPTYGSAAGGGGSGNFNAAAIDAAPPAAATALTDHVPASQAGVLVFETPQQLLDAIGLLATAGAVAGANLLPLSQAGVSKSLSLTTLKTAFDVGGGLALGYSQTSGTVTSVGMTVPGWLTVGGSPVTSAGTLAVIATPAQTAAQVVATSGTAASIVNLRALTKEHLAGAAATTGALGAVQLAGDLGGPAVAPTVVGVNGVALPVGVANGGSGLATLSTFALLAGGTTATGALQQVAGLGTSGQVLTSNGTAALPTWQAAGAAGANTALSNLAAVAINTTLATGAGTALALVTTAAAATASTTAGVGLTLTADAAVAGTTNAGAAQGGDVTITAGAAAQKTSGNARGGAIFLIPGAGIGTGSAGGFGLWGTTASFPGLKQRSGQGQIQITDATWAGRQTLWAAALGIGGTMDNFGTNDAFITQTGNSGASIRASSGNAIGWTSGGDASQSPDSQLSRKAAGSISFDTTARGNGLGRASQRNSTAAAATTTEYPNDKDWGIHQNTTTGAIFLVHNNGGTIVSVQLS